MFGNVAAQYDVRFSANVGTFRADMEAVRLAAREGYGGISSAALRASVAEEKYERALARTKVGSLAANRATLAYRKEVEALQLEQSGAAGPPPAAACTARRSRRRSGASAGSSAAASRAAASSAGRRRSPPRRSSAAPASRSRSRP